MPKPETPPDPELLAAAVRNAVAVFNDAMRMATQYQIIVHLETEVVHFPKPHLEFRIEHIFAQREL